MPSVMILQNSEDRHNANSIQMLLENRLIPNSFKSQASPDTKNNKANIPKKKTLQTNILHDQRWKKPS